MNEHTIPAKLSDHPSVWEHKGQKILTDDLRREIVHRYNAHNDMLEALKGPVSTALDDATLAVATYGSEANQERIKKAYAIVKVTIAKAEGKE